MRCPQHATCPDCDHQASGWLVRAIGFTFLALLLGVFFGVVFSCISRETHQQIILKGHGHWATRPDGSPEFDWNAPCAEKK